MPGPLSIALPLVLAGVLIASGFAKLRHPDDLSSWADLGVPPVVRREWLRRLHPWGELALAVSLAVLGGVLGVLAAVVAVALMSAYLWLVWRAYRKEPDASCACFGSRVPITRVTIARNLWLTALAIAAVGVIWMNPSWGGALAAISPEDVSWIIGATVAVGTVAVVLVSESSQTSVSAADGSKMRTEKSAATIDAEGELDYVRTRTPAVPVTQGDGTVVSLRKLATIRPLILLAVSTTCAACSPVIERIHEWRALLPELDVRVLVLELPEASSLTEDTGQQSLHDPHQYVRESLGWSANPTAVLLGADGLLAGGPVTGYEAISEFITQVNDSLRELRAAQV